MISQVHIFDPPDILAMKMKVKKVCDLFDFNMSGLKNNTVSHMGGRIWMKYIQNITILFNAINMCLALNPDFVSHRAKSLFLFFWLLSIFWILFT